MIKNILMILVLSFFSTLVNAAQCPAKVYGDCAKGDKQCLEAKKKGMENDHKHYQKWCQQHPKQCAKTHKMF